MKLTKLLPRSLAIPFLAWIGVFLAACPCVSADSPLRISILEKDGDPKIGPQSPPPYLDVLEQMGLVVAFPDAKERAPLTWERLRKFNLLVLTTSPNMNSLTGASYAGHDQVPPKEFNELLDRYLREGGGILYIGPLAATFISEHNDLNDWLKPYGAQFEWATFEDDAHRYDNPPTAPMQIKSYFWTGQIADSPITRGVKTLFYHNQFYRSPTVRPLQVSSDWQVLVSSEPTAATYQLVKPIGPDKMCDRIPETKTTGSRPMVAVRQVGKGRLALVGLDAATFWYDLGKPVRGQVCESRGDGTRSSDWLPLLKYLAEWLSEPARQAGFPGGATERARHYVNTQYGSRDPIDWERPEISWPDSEIHRLCTQHSGFTPADWRELAAGTWKPFKFLVGAQTVRSGGKGTVVDWKKAARAAGFDGVIFRERILDLTKEQWEAFEAECNAASDDTFYAVPGQEFEDWEGNRFYRYHPHIPYPKSERLTSDGKRVRDQLAFFFDAGWPVNMPLTVKGNDNPHWLYRVYNAIPVALYQNGKQIEDNTKEWEDLIRRIEDPIALGVHLLDDPSQIAATRNDTHLLVLAPSLRQMRTDERWARLGLGALSDNVPLASASSGPVIDAYLPLHMYRTTLGSRGVEGSYRYRILVRAHSEAPITRVELWGDGQCLRRYQPNSKEVALTIDEQHDKQRGLFLRVVDARGGVALASKIVAHDKQMVFNWCGDHCNALPWGQGIDEKGNPDVIGISTHAKARWYDLRAGPAASANETHKYYYPYGVDQSAPPLGFFARFTLHTTRGVLPDPKAWLVNDMEFRHSTRDLMITRQAIALFADHEKYNAKDYGFPSLHGWGPYFRSQPTPDFDVTQQEYELHRDTGQPALQYCEGEFRFKRAVTFADKAVINIELGHLWPRGLSRGVSIPSADLAKRTFDARLGRGNFITSSGEFGRGTLFALDDTLAARVAVDAKGNGVGELVYGCAVGGRSFKAGEVLPYRLLIMRWPMGAKVEDKLDAHVQAALNLREPQSGARITARHGTVKDTQLIQTLAAKQFAFRGDLAKGDFGFRVPARVAGLNANWTAGVWRDEQGLFIPLGLDPDGWAWFSFDAASEAGPFFVGNQLTCERPEIVLRLLQRSDGDWTVIAHNPLDRKLSFTVRGTEGGPVAGLARKITLVAGGETCWTERGRK